VKNAQVPNQKRIYSAGTYNLCLLPNFTARINNQDKTGARAHAIGRNIVEQQLAALRGYESNNGSFAKHYNDDQKHTVNGTITHITRRHSKDDTAESKGSNFTSNNMASQHRILEEFPPLDFLLIQEAWLQKSSEDLGRHLHRHFPYIIYDARKDGYKLNRWCASSGLMIASRYPILEVDFKCFEASTKYCIWNSKGLLQAKVDLGCTSDGKKLVGYIANTHLQVFEGKESIQWQQLFDLCRWTKEFRQKTQHSRKEELVVFDIMGGDFNFDNHSPSDVPKHRHPLFSLYKDPARVKPGLDYGWAVGTDMRHRPLHDKQISTARGLREALENKHLRQRYLIDADVTVSDISMAWRMPNVDRHGNIEISPDGGKRRVDYVLYRNGDGVKTVDCNPVTQLATLTDHVAYSLTVETLF